MAKKKMESKPIDAKQLKANLIEELLQIAALPICLNRLEKLETLHKRINAVTRYLSEQK